MAAELKGEILQFPRRGEPAFKDFTIKQKFQVAAVFSRKLAAEVFSNRNVQEVIAGTAADVIPAVLSGRPPTVVGVVVKTALVAGLVAFRNRDSGGN